MMPLLAGGETAFDGAAKRQEDSAAVTLGQAVPQPPGRFQGRRERARGGAAGVVRWRMKVLQAEAGRSAGGTTAPAARAPQG